MTRARVVGVVLTATFGCSRSTELITLPPAECAVANPVVHLGGTDNAHCAGALAAQFGRYALCSCNDLILLADLFVGELGKPRPVPPSRDSPQPSDGGTGGGPPANGGQHSHPPNAMDGSPGAVGVNGDVKVKGPTLLTGTMVVSSADGITLSGGNIQRNLRSEGSVSTDAPFSVGGDLFSGADVSGPFSIGTELHLPASGTVGPNVQSPGVIREEVTVDSPCRCEDGPLFDIAKEVTAHAADNANQTVSFTGLFADEVHDSQTFDWPCGSYYLPGIRSGEAASLEFRIHGHVAIFVDGDVRLGDDLVVTLDRGAELDLVVAGSFYMMGRIFGATKSPASFRLWVGSTTISLGDQIQFGAVVYAPQAVLSAGVSLTMNGSVFVQTVNAADDVNIYYDSNAAAGGAICGVAPPDPVE